LLIQADVLTDSIRNTTFQNKLYNVIAESGGELSPPF
jgi:hypothetical protein